MAEDNQEGSMYEESAPESPSNTDLVPDPGLSTHCSPPGSPSFDVTTNFDIIDSASDSGELLLEHVQTCMG